MIIQNEIFNDFCEFHLIRGMFFLVQKISFSTIRDSLGLSDHWEVFDFLIEALNYGYVKGKLDEPANVLYVEEWETRDLRLDEMEIVRTKLDTL